MKKVIIFGVIIAVLFAGLLVLNNYSKQSRLAGADNPYGKDDLHTSTIAQLKDSLYRNQILPADLKQLLENDEDILVYFYSPECQYCKQATPILVPLAEEMGANVFKYNLLEFTQGWKDHNIEYTPTLVSYKKGEEQLRLVGLQTEDVYKKLIIEHQKK